MPQVDPLAVEDAWTTSSSGELTLLRMSGLRADRVDRDGHSLGSFIIPSPSRILSDDEKRAARDSLQAYFAEHPLRILPLSGGRLHAQLITQVVPLLLLTGTLPSIIPSSIAVDDAGGLWLARAATLAPHPTGAQLFARANGADRIYLVVDSKGMISRSIRLPAGAEIQAVVGRDIYATISSPSGLALVRMDTPVDRLVVVRGWRYRRVSQ
jgi:hypothetical protein